MQQSLSRSDREFLAGLHRTGPLRVMELCKIHGLTATAIRHRLTRLQAEGLVERQTIRSDRGRPFHKYHVSAAGQRALGDDYASLAKLLWREISRLEDELVRERMMEGLKRAMVTRYQSGSSATSIRERFEQLEAALRREGFEVATEVLESDVHDELLPVLREHSCPYHELAAEDRGICELEQSVFEEVLGVAVTLTQCCHDGHSCCEFTPALEA